MKTVSAANAAVTLTGVGTTVLDLIANISFTPKIDFQELDYASGTFLYTPPLTGMLVIEYIIGPGGTAYPMPITDAPVPVAITVAASNPTVSIATTQAFAIQGKLATDKLPGPGGGVPVLKQTIVFMVLLEGDAGAGDYYA